MRRCRENCLLNYATRDLLFTGMDADPVWRWFPLASLWFSTTARAPDEVSEVVFPTDEGDADCRQGCTP